MTARRSADTFAWCFSTLGCPELSLEETCALAAEFNVPGLELRALANTIDLPEYFSATHLNPERVTALLQENHVNLVVAASSFSLESTAQEDRDSFLRFCAWAEALHFPCVRVFGGGKWGTPLSEAQIQTAARNASWWLKEKSLRGWRIQMLMETHDAYSASAPCVKLNECLDAPLCLIWDTHHTWRLGGETPAESWKQIGPLVRHVHIKDSVEKSSGQHPCTFVLPGSGRMPLGEVISVLRANQFNGSVSLEWERLWHPDLPPLREALAALQKQPWFKPA